MVFIKYLAVAGRCLEIWCNIFWNLMIPVTNAGTPKGDQVNENRTCEHKSYPQFIAQDQDIEYLYSMTFTVTMPTI